MLGKRRGFLLTMAQNLTVVADRRPELRGSAGVSRNDLVQMPRRCPPSSPRLDGDFAFKGEEI